MKNENLKYHLSICFVLYPSCNKKSFIFIFIYFIFFYLFTFNEKVFRFTQISYFIRIMIVYRFQKIIVKLPFKCVYRILRLYSEWQMKYNVKFPHNTPMNIWILYSSEKNALHHDMPLFIYHTKRYHSLQYCVFFKCV